MEAPMILATSRW